MNKRFLLPAAALAMLLGMQSCSKQNELKPAVAQPASHLNVMASIGNTGQFATFKILNIAATGKALDVTGYALKNGDKAGLSAYVNDAPGHNNQKWKLRNEGGGYFSAMNMGSGKFLEAQEANQQVIQNQRVAGSDKQLWKVEGLPAGGYKIISKYNGLALSNPGPAYNNAVVGLGAYVNATYQGWNFTIIPADCYRDDEVLRFFQRTTGSSAFDGGSSVPLSTGQVLWLTNDTFFNQTNAQGNFSCGTIFPYRNSSLLQPASKSWDPAQTVNIRSPYGIETFRTADNKSLLWPGAAIQVGSKVYVHNIEVPRNSLNTSNQYITEMSVGATPTNIPAPKNMVIPGMSGQTAIIYSIGMVKPGDGFVYVYGAGGFLNAGVYVARAPESNIMAMTYWNGVNWVATPTTANAARIYSGFINNNTVGYTRGKFIIIDMSYGFTCDAEPRDVYVATSSSPIGPFTARKKVYTLPDIKQGHKPVFYNPTIHAEFDNGDNELLVNYCVNWYGKNDGKGGMCLVDCSNADGTKDPNDYRPKPIRIPFSLIGM